MRAFMSFCLSWKASRSFLVKITLILIVLLAMFPFSLANGSAPTMKAPGPGTIPTIDGKWNAVEWDDAPQYDISGPGGSGYVRIKHSSTHLFVIIDSVWDMVQDPISGSYEGTYVAFDTAHNHSLTPQTDDFLFFNAYSKWMTAWRGNGTQWVVLVGSGFDGNQSLGTSPNSATPHRIDEMAIPLQYVGSISSTSGFYALVRDDGSDPDGYGPAPPAYWVEWPASAGGDPRGWPMQPQYYDPCPAPSAWGHLALLLSPTAAFTWRPLNPDVNEHITFNATGSQDDGSIIKYTWNFGDGNVTTVSIPLIDHTFSTGGSYGVNLIVTDNDGLNGSAVHTVNVGVTAVFAFSPSSPNPNVPVTFNATSSSSPGGTIVNYAWDFGDGNKTSLVAPIIVHVFSTGGSYSVNLTVTDNLARKAWVTSIVEVGSPVASFIFWPSKPNANDATLFDATASSDPDGIANYTWNWGDSSSNITTNKEMTHTFSVEGNYTVSLTVADNTGLEGSVINTIEVYAPREAHFSYFPSTPNIGDVVTFNATLSNDPGGTIANYTWNFNDGNTTTTIAKVITHAFSAKGSFLVNLTITDNDGLKSWSSKMVSVAVPQAMITVPFTPINPQVDGNWTSGEWVDAPQYDISGPGGTGYIRVKHNGTHIFIIIDSVWDTTQKATFGSYEGTYVAFDKSHDKSTLAPQSEDYLFFNAYSAWLNAWQGNGTRWVILQGTGFKGEQPLGTSPNSATPHRIDEMSIPLTYVGSVNSAVGFYIIVRDDGSDPDGGGPLPPTRYVEWPGTAGGNPNGWPTDPGYIDPCPTPSTWGYLILEPQKLGLSSITVNVDLLTILLGKSVTISGSVFRGMTGAAGVDVTIKCLLNGTTNWLDITTLTTDSSGSFSCAWTPTKAGIYKIKATWNGDSSTYNAESDLKTFEVTEPDVSSPFLIPMIILALVVIGAVIVIVVYLRKSKR